MRTGEMLTVTAVDYDTNGYGVAKTEGFVVFVRGLMVGEEAEVQVINSRRNYAYAKVRRLITFSSQRVTPKCPIASACGGCQIQHFSVDEQARYKQAIVENLMKYTAKTDVVPLPIIQMDDPWRYRNKVQVPFGKDFQGKLIYGFYRAQTHNILPFADCMLQSTIQNDVLKFIADFYNERNIFPETLRWVLLKRGIVSEEIMCVLITSGIELELKKELKEALLYTFPPIKAIIQNVNTREDNVILGDEEINLSESSTIQDSLGDYTFNISSKSFYQVNPIQAKVIYDKVIEFAQFKPTDIVMDLYCGVGTIALYISKHVKEVLGVDVVAEAIEDAKQNAKLNKVKNVSWYTADAGEIARTLHTEGKAIDIIIVDPPRKGLNSPTIEAIADISPRKVIYVSCDPGTLARDLALFQTKGYEVKIIQPVDMFPQTVHVETVVLLTRVDKNV
jgi:23S rRNA (uracil1939-C5)-methyltransferase